MSEPLTIIIDLDAGPKPYPLDERGLEHAGEIPSFMRRA